MPSERRNASPLRATIETLLAPLESAGDEWRDEVCRRLRVLGGFDVAFFRLSDAHPTRIDPLGPLEAREAYRREFRPLDPWPKCDLPVGGVRMETIEGLIGPRRLDRDPYYNRFLRPYGVTEYLGVQVATTIDHHGHIGLFNSGPRPSRREPSDNIQSMRMVVPALVAGIRAWHTAQNAIERSGSVLDGLEGALLLCDGGGRILHANTAMRALFVRDPSERVLRNGLERVAREFTAARRAGHDPLGRTRVGVEEISTPLRRYRVRRLMADRFVPKGAAVLLMVDSVQLATAAAGSLEDRFGLTAREASVARLLAKGLDNASIAAELGIRGATARNHTARILRKLGVRSRSQVHGILSR